MSTKELAPEEIIALLQEAPGEGLVLEGVQARLELPRTQRPALRRMLKRMAGEGQLVRSGRVYRLPRAEEPRSGTFRAKARGGGVVLPDGGGPAIHVREARAGGALDLDRVLVRVISDSRLVPQGAVVALLGRERRIVAGTIERRGGCPWLLPDDARLPELLPVVPGEEKGATTGQAVVAEPVTEAGLTRVRVIEVLGSPGGAGVEEAKLIHLFGLRQEMPAAVLAEAEALPAGIDAAEASARWDLRGTPLVTIDPADARDFDDAVAVSEAEGGGFVLTVAIADVSHYVRTGSAIDQEARERGCSVYLPGRVLPMLPRRLANELCSLTPGEDRLAYAVQLRLDAGGAVQAARIEPAIIRSRARLTYEGVAAVLDGAPLPGDPANAHADGLFLLARLGRILLQRRLAGGAFDLELAEAHAVWDPAAGRVVDVEQRQRNWAHRLVEEAMLAANRAVGARLLELGRPALWRVHEPPDPEDVAEVVELARLLFPGSRPPFDLSGLLRWAQRQPAGDAVGEVLAHRVLRAMKQARYSEADLGHFGLGTRGYLHFTSPIRRYPDLVVHRLLRGSSPDHGLPLAALASQCSQRERAAMAAEQAALQLHGTLLLEERLGETLRGTITGISRGGLFVQLERPCVQGMVLVASLPPDHYEVAPTGHLAVGRRTGTTFRLGDRLDVVVDACYPQRRHVDLRLA